MDIQKELEQKAQLYANKIVKLPFVKMVCLTGSVASGKANEKSDIDFLVIVKRGRIYLARAICVLAAVMWGEYRSDTNIAGKLCLNWFIVSQSQICISKLKTNWDKIGKIRLLSERNQESPLEKLLSGDVGDVLEQLAKKYQIWRIKKDPRTHMRGSEVRWSDDELGFHPRKD